MIFSRLVEDGTITDKDTSTIFGGTNYWNMYVIKLTYLFGLDSQKFYLLGGETLASDEHPHHAHK